ncbi:MAG: hypothetical protein OXE95_12845 [Chloroflexi bacterium]|nr:hypothetical protein [Chloroflexota bacterium]MCY4248449.1 hypothetical protein [Chloroflexota bacterium]
MQALRRVKHVAQPAERPRVGDVGVFEAVDPRRGIDEIGVDLPVVDVGDHQQRRVLEAFAIAQQLLIRFIQISIFVRRFVFDSKVILKIDIGESMPAAQLQRCLEGKVFSRCRAAIRGHGDANQLTDIQEVHLGDLPLAKRRIRPFVDKFLRRHRHNSFWLGRLS